MVAGPKILYKSLAEPTEVNKITSSKIGELIHICNKFREAFSGVELLISFD